MYSGAVQALRIGQYKTVKTKVTGAHLRESGSQHDGYNLPTVKKETLLCL